jgi:hypothetical protein
MVTVVTAAPAISAAPAPVIVNVGQPIVLSVSATGYPAPTYQWFKNTGSGAVAIPGATGSAFTVASAATADIGSYHVVATNFLDSAESAPVTVTVTVITPSITTPPTATTAVLGQPATFTVEAAGSAPLSYQWYKGDTLIVGANSATYTIPVTTGASAGDYRVVVTNEGGSSPSAAAALNLVVTAETSILATNFANDTIHAAAPVVNATTTNWYVMASKVATTSNVGDDPATPDVVEARPLTLALNQPSGSANFQAATVFTNSPLDLAQTGTSVKVTATVQANNVITLGFGLFNSGGSLPNTIHNAGLAAGSLLGGNEGVTGGTQNWTGYRGLVTSGSVNGDIRHRLAQNNPTPTTNRSQDLVVPGSGTVSYGQPLGTTVGTMTQSAAALTFVNDTTYTLVYQIARTGANQYSISERVYQGTDTSASTGVLLFSASAPTTNAATLPSAVTSVFDSFAIGGRTTNNQPPKITVSALSVAYAAPVPAIVPAFTTQPAGVAVAPGASFTLTSLATGSPAPTYQWFKGVNPIPGQTSASYTVASATAGDAGNYTVVATNVVSAVSSEIATVTVGTPASAYDTWASGFGLDPATNGAPNANPSGDGVANVLKFTLGGSPLVANSTPSPVLARAGANLTFAYTVNTAAAAQFSVAAESSSDLSVWTPAVHGVGGITIATTPVTGTTSQVVVTVPAGPTRLFLRLKVLSQP